MLAPCTCAARLDPRPVAILVKMRLGASGRKRRKLAKGACAKASRAALPARSRAEYGPHQPGLCTGVDAVRKGELERSASSVQGLLENEINLQSVTPKCCCCHLRASARLRSS